MEKKIEKIDKRINISLVSPFTIILFLAFFFAKIFDKIDWSWWLIFSPLWIPFALLGVILLIVGIVYLVIVCVDKLT